MKHPCRLDITYCGTCSTELEEGQVGVCDDCRTYTFAQLSDNAKDKARDALRYTDHYLEYEWWDSVYEDAARIATILGIDLMRTERRKVGKSYETPDISFSGFCSQGDGACFAGHYHFNPNSVAEINAYCNDEKLISIATELFTLQLARRLLGLESFSAAITTAGSYSHSNAMSVEVHFEEDDEHPIDAIEDDAIEDEVTNVMRSFADWIYATLEKEHDYLMSDEVVDDQLADETFDEDGVSV